MVSTYIVNSETEWPELFRYDTAGEARNKAARAMSAVGVRTRQSAGLRGIRSKAIDRKPGKLTQSMIIYNLNYSHYFINM